MLQPRLPLIVGLTLEALGTVEGRRIRRPMDPVAAWLLRKQPGLAPEDGARAAFTTIRARTSVVDALLAEELHRARGRGEKVRLVLLGAGFDARWFRMLNLLDEGIDEHVEIESPELLTAKHALLSASPWAALWKNVVQRPVAESEWTVPDVGRPTLVVMEGLAGRLDPDALRALLHRVRRACPAARVLLGLPGFSGQPGAWSRPRLREMGWDVEVDVRLAPRGRLLTATAEELCPGMHAVRLLKLAPRESP